MWLQCTLLLLWGLPWSAAFGSMCCFRSLCVQATQKGRAAATGKTQKVFRIEGRTGDGDEEPEWRSWRRCNEKFINTDFFEINTRIKLCRTLKSYQPIIVQ